MKYISTRGESKELGFEEVLLKGLAPDGGLYVPLEWPSLDFNKLNNQKKGKGGEVHITDSIRRLINDGEKFIGHTFKGKYLDCGTINGYIKSSLEISKL